MISFIIIGRNEGWKLTKCFKSIFNTIKTNELNNPEIIYVDSNSTDNSIVIAKKFMEIKIFKITGVCNAAIGRNIGAKESRGDVLFFIDGDMEIIAEFLPLVYNEKIGLKFDFVSGQFIDIRYNYKGDFIEEVPYYRNLNCDKYFSTTGGIFLIKKDLWNLVGGMKNKYKRSQEVDFALRLSKKGFLLLRKKELIAKHYTVDYMDSKRMWKMLFGGYHFYARGLLYREHIFNKYIYKRVLREDSTLVIFVLSTVLNLLFSSFSFYYFYFVMIILRILLQKRGNFFEKLQRIPYQIIKDITILLSFLFFYPQRISDKNINYVKID